MPMPPPKPTTEGPRDRQVFHEMGQIVRAIEAERPADPGLAPPAASGRRTGRRPGSTGPSPSPRPTDSSPGTRKGYST